MNIESSGLLSLLSSGGVDAFKQAILDDGGSPGEFAGALLEEIQHFQSQSELAAILGKSLPGVGNEIAINLEDTIETLQDVLDHITAATSLSDQEIVKNIAVRNPVLDSVGLEQKSEADLRAKAIDRITKLAGFEQKSEANLRLPAMAVTTEEDVINELLQNENALKKPGMLNQVIQEKQAEKMVELPEGGADDVMRPLPKVAADIAQINRQIASENRNELPVMNKPVGHPGWNQELGDRILWMQSRAVPSAELRLNPPHLGPIAIRIDVNQDQASIAFTAHSAAVRDAIDSAIPRLREMLGNQQLTLVDVGISQHSFSDPRQSAGFSQTGQEQDAEHNADIGMMAANDAQSLDLPETDESSQVIMSKGILNIYV